jgi:TolB-like protein
MKERKFFQWALAYLAGAFVVFQLLDALAEPLGLSLAVQQVILAVVALGFALTLVLAWYHGEKGRQRASGPELLMMAALLVIAGAAIWFVRGRDAATTTPPQSGVSLTVADLAAAPSIAVLPFEDMSPTGDQDYLGDGIAEEILNALTKVGGLKVAARTSSFSFRDKGATVREIGQQLGVKAILEGSVQTEGTRIRITAQLIDAADGFHIWSESYDRNLESVFALQDEIARRIVRSLREELLGDVSGPLVTEATADLEAYRLYLEARKFGARQTGEDLQRSIELFEAAIERDSTFAEAYAGLSSTYLAAGLFGYMPVTDVLPVATEMAERALALNENLAEVHAALMLIHYAEFRWAEAERSVNRALELKPAYAQAHGLRGLLFAVAGQLEESLEAWEWAYTLDPLSTWTVANYGTHLSMARDYESSEARLLEALELDPNYWLTYGSLIGLYLETGRPQQAVEMTERMASLDAPTFELEATQAYMTAWFYVAFGERETALEFLDTATGLLVESDRRGTHALSMARVYALLGETESALEWLERQTDWAWPHAPSLHWDPAFEAIREEPRFQAVVESKQRAWGLR